MPDGSLGGSIPLSWLMKTALVDDLFVRRRIAGSLGNGPGMFTPYISIMCGSKSHCQHVPEEVSGWK
jgi:hypothetical protein